MSRLKKHVSDRQIIDPQKMQCIFFRNFNDGHIRTFKLYRKV